MRIRRDIETEKKVLRSPLYKGSYKKGERILRVIREKMDSLLRGDFTKTLAALRFSESRRAKDLASFLNYVYTSFDLKDLKQIYLEKGPTRKRYRWKHHGMRVHQRRTYRYVVTF